MRALWSSLEDVSYSRQEQEQMLGKARMEGRREQKAAKAEQLEMEPKGEQDSKKEMRTAPQKIRSEPKPGSGLCQGGILALELLIRAEFVTVNCKIKKGKISTP